MKISQSLYLLFLAPLFVSNSVTCAEQTPTFEWGGRIQADNTNYDNDKFVHSDGSELRRARLFISGNLSDNWDYKVQYDFAPDSTALKDGFIRYSGFNNSRITVGNFKQFSSLEELTSSNNITFTERAMLNTLVTSRRVGIGFQNWSDNYSIAVSTYTHGANNLVRGNGYAGRFVYRPQLGGQAMLHLGLAVSREEDDDDTIRRRARPESHQDSHRLINTGKIANIDGFSKIGLEAAYVNRRFSAQSEFVRQKIARRIGSDLTFDGYYAYASYFLTNDRRPYSTSDAAFGTVSPSSPDGAWQIAARISNLELTDRDITGGEANIITLGVNYYMNRNLRFSANYILADSDDIAGDDDPNAIQLRIRYTF